LTKELQNEKRSNDDNLNDLSPKSKQSNNFEINTYFDDDYYLPEKYKQNELDKNEDDHPVSTDKIVLEFDDVLAQNERSKAKNQNS